MRKIVVMLLGCLILTGCGKSGVSQAQYESVVAERDALKEQLASQAEFNNAGIQESEAAQTAKDLAGEKSIEFKDTEKIEVVNEYFYIRYEENARYFIVLKNNSGSVVDIEANVIAKDKAGKLLGAGDDRLQGLENGQEMVMGFYFDDAGSASKFEYSLDVKESVNESYYSDLEWETSVNKDKLIIMITNNGKETAENVYPYALFFKNGEIFSHEYAGYTEIKAGETIPVELKCYDGEFEDYKLFIAAWGSKLGSTKPASIVKEENSDTVEGETNSQIETETNEPKKETDNIHIPTVGQKNALSKAKDYLGIMTFSYNGLIEQLIFDGFTQDEAAYAADNCGADWNAQAANKAKVYLDLMSFSKKGLIEQLEFDGFTHEQAVYGVEQNGF